MVKKLFGHLALIAANGLVLGGLFLLLWQRISGSRNELKFFMDVFPSDLRLRTYCYWLSVGFFPFPPYGVAVNH